MQVIPAIDVEGGRSRTVFWPGVSSGVGAPTDRPDRIAEHFVGLGAPAIHLVDFDGARQGRPVNLEVVGAIAARVATPLQLAGGLGSPDAIRLAFAAGATRIVAETSLADEPAVLRACLDVAGDWLAIGLDARPDRLRAFPWHRAPPASVAELARELRGLGLSRFVLSHATGPAGLQALGEIVASTDAELLVAGGARDPAAIRRVRDAGAAAIILGDALLSGAVDYPTASEAAR
ncbi:MAG TPA: HisA/HisF-related TIM barrel protein [Candidatus Limnocylindrales bacterium]|nr:HisA/HisF-related TIM barrel protein [Candidatus Limnocylindrales bacterium]